MNPQSKARTWRLPLSTLVVNSDPISPISKPVEVIEKFAYDKAVEALKWIKEEWCIEGCECKSCETLRDLGVE